MLDWTKPIKCKIKGYSGVVLLRPFSLEHYKLWLDYEERRKEASKSGNGHQVITYLKSSLDDVAEDAENADDAYGFYTAETWELVLMLMDLSDLSATKGAANIELIQAALDKSKDDVSGASVPYELSNWLCPVVLEYVEQNLNPFG